MERLLYFLKWRNLNERADLLNLHKSKVSDSPSAETREKPRVLYEKEKKKKYFVLNIAQQQSAKPIKKTQTRELRREIPSLVQEE